MSRTRVRILSRAWIALAIACCVVVGAATALSQNAGRQPQRAAQIPSPARSETAWVPLFTEEEFKMSGPLPSAEFYIHLPESIQVLDGAKLVIKYRPSPVLLPEVSTMTVSWNGVPLTSVHVNDPPVAAGEPVVRELTATLRASQIRDEWNRVTVTCQLQTTTILCRDVDNPACWLVLEDDSHVTVPFQREILTPDLSRFPESLAEEQLLHQEQLLVSFDQKAMTPIASVLFPEAPSDAELRGFFIAASRLGQETYLRENSVAIGRPEEWNQIAVQRNGVIVGLREKIAALDLPVETKNAVAALNAGEGLVQEFIVGDPGTAQRRWILLSGADEQGLQRAALALGSNDFLSTTVSNPVVVAEDPVIFEFTERLAHPMRRPQTLQVLGAGDILIQGVFKGTRSLAWVLPPGYETVSGSYMNLVMSHVPDLSRDSALQIVMNGNLAAGIPLTVKTEDLGTVGVEIPGGILGRDPNELTFNAYLDIGTVDCSHRDEERAWLFIGGQTELKLTARRLQINGLDRFSYVLLRDAFLRRAAVALPRESTIDELEVVKNLALRTGSRLPSMPVLWPQAVGYGKNEGIAKDKLANRSIIFLGSVAEWTQALKGDVPLTISSKSEDQLVLRGQTVPLSHIEPTLVFAEFLKSPWGENDCIVLVGGPNGFGSEVADKMLTDPSVAARLAGTASGLDSKGRVFTYDVRLYEEDSLAEEIDRRVPLGESAKETARAIARKIKRSEYITTQNLVIASIVLVLVISAIRMQMALISRRRKERREKLEKTDDKASGPED